MTRPAPLPTRDGVGPSCMVLPAGPYATIAECLMQIHAHVPAEEWLRRMAAGEVVDAHGRRITRDAPHAPGLRIYYYRVVRAERAVPFEETVLYRDAHIVVADKPHFLPVTPSGRHLHETLLVRLKRRLDAPTLAPVHRIDRETAGLVLLSIDPATRGAYQRLFAQHAVAKTYECIAPTIDPVPTTRHTRLEDDPEHFMRMREVAGPPNALTRIERIASDGSGWSLYRLSPTSGKRHQLRVHCAAMGMPILGDRIYPALLPVDTDDHANPLRLVARQLAYTDPVTNEPRQFTSAARLAFADHQ